jgi:alpha-beta hydrolase superfamily lysophospholipase
MAKKIKPTALLFVLLFSCHKPNQQINAIVTLNDKVQPLSEVYKIIDKTIKEINSSQKNDNLILFVHGRGKHPEKAFNKHFLADLEKDYSAKAIMFHWPSWEGRFAFPTQKARNAAQDFLHVLQVFDQYKQENKNKTNGIKFTLLTNSMGSIVLEQSMKNYGGHLGSIFDTLVISAPASAAKGHHKWVEKINFSNNVYITINQKDKLLGKLGIKLIGKRLGKGLTSLFGNNFKKARKAHYIDLTKSQLAHRYYLHRDLINKPRALRFYNKVLNGLCYNPPL